MAGLCTPLPTLRRRPCGRLRTARGRCGSLLLHRKGLAPSTPCRSPGALRKPSHELTLAGSCLLFERQTLVSRTGLKNCEPISQLSKMQKQRVGLASSLVTLILVLALITVAPRRLSCRQSLGQPCCKERLLLFL